MNKLFIMALLGILAICLPVEIHSQTQDIERIHYFFNSDPGIDSTGNGGFISTTSDSIIDTVLSITIPTSLPSGVNYLYLRTEDQEGSWSLYERRPFYIAEDPANLVIEEIQYFFDSDPGIGVAGNGGIIPVGPSADIDQVFNINIEPNLVPGLHFLYIRARDQLGSWSLYERRPFYIAEDPENIVIEEIQYFFDSDPGIGVAGNGSIIPVGPSADIDQVFNINIDPDLDPGLHFLYIRGKAQNGVWSLYERRPFYIADISNEIVAMEYFYDNDPGVGSANPLTVTPTDSVDEIIPIGVPCLGEGTHYLYIRAQDEHGSWSLYARDTFNIDSSEVEPAVVSPAGPINICPNETVTLSFDPIDGIDYHWTLDGDTIAGATGSEYEVLEAGEYAVRTICDTVFTASNTVSVSYLPEYTYFADNDGDGYGDPAIDTVDCSTPAGYVIDNTDCDDGNADIHPGTAETCNGIDDNCDGNIDEGVQNTYYADNDSDGYGDAGNSTLACSPPSGYVANDSDCDDTDVNINPGVSEVCNGIDDNCDGNIDEGVQNTYYADNDGDGYGDAGNATLACALPSGYVANDSDCDDTDVNINPSEIEVCNGVDDNCDGVIDEGYVYSVAPTSISSDLGTEICEGESVVLTLHGGILGTGATWYWYESSCGGASIGSGTSISVQPSPSINDYFVRAEGSCNTSACASISIQVNTLPEITTCSADITVSTETDSCSAEAGYNTVVYGSPLPDISYVFSGATSQSGSGTGSGNRFEVGLTQVSIIASNVCGSDTCQFEVEVTDDQPPVLLSCPSDIQLEVDEGSWGAEVTWSEPLASDNCGSVSLSSNHGSGDFFNVGTTTITYTATDDANNTSTCSFTVTVNEPDILGDVNLSIFADDISISDYTPDTSELITIEATITNTSAIDAGSFTCRLLNQYDSTIYADTVVTELKAGRSTLLTWEITTPDVPAFVPMQVLVDVNDDLTESNELDNQAIRPFINGAFDLDAAILVTVSPESNSVVAGQSINLCGTAVYDNTAVALSDYSVAGAEVELTIIETGQKLYGNTNVYGEFCMAYRAPLTPGSLSFHASVTDYTLIGKSDTAVFEVTPLIETCPTDLKLVEFNLDGPFLCGSSQNGYKLKVGEGITSRVKLENGCSAIVDSTVLYVYSPASSPQAQSIVIPPLASGEFHTVDLPAMDFNSVGSTYLLATLDYENVVQETNENNNSKSFPVEALPATNDLIPLSVSTGTNRECSFNHFSIVVYNQGGSPSGPFDVFIEILEDGMVLYSSTESILDIPGECTHTIEVPMDVDPFLEYEVRVTVDVNDEVVETSEMNNYLERSTTFTECDPDLWIHDCAAFDVKPADPVYPGTIIASAVIGNQGLSDAEGPFEVHFNVGDSSYIVMVNDTIPVDGATTVTRSIPTPPHATESLTVVADGIDQIAEEDESNNSHSKQLCWDFSLTNTRCDSSAAMPGVQKLCHPGSFGIAVRNRGVYEASSFRLNFEISGPGLPSGWNDLGDTTYYLANTCFCPWYVELDEEFYFPQTGNYQVRITADPNNAYVECNEGDNELIVGINVIEAPDYATYSEYIAPSKLNPEVNEAITFVGSYQNDGCTGLDSFELLLQMNETAIDSILVEPIDSGTFTSYAFSQPWSSGLSGLHIARLIVDHDKEIDEVDETNNEATRAIIVGRSPDMHFASLNPSDWNPSSGEEINITASIKNEGDIGASSTLRLYLVNGSGIRSQISEEKFFLAGFDSLDLVMDWMVSDRFANIEGVIVNTDPEEYDLSDNHAEFYLNGLDITAQSTDVLCETLDTGKVQVSVTGGKQPYLIQWSNGQNGYEVDVDPGTYTVSVTDANGFVKTDTAIVELLDSPEWWYEDSDGDSYGSDSTATLSCDSISGYVLIGGDCNDLDTLINPAAQEACNGLDDDCDGLIDDDDPSVNGRITWYLDADGDGYGNQDSSLLACLAPPDYVIVGTDCDDADSTRYPGNTEVLDGVDNDCDGQVDEGLSTIEVDIGDCRVVYFGYGPDECADLVAVITDGVPPYTYSWSTGETTAEISVCPDSTRTFSLTVTDSLGSTAMDDVTVQSVDVRCGRNGNKVSVCHIPEGNPNNPRDICIDESAVETHLTEHGDYLGSCSMQDPCTGLTLESGSHDHIALDRSHDFENSAEELEVNMYPNPAFDRVQILSNLKMTELHIIDMRGRTIRVEKPLAESTALDLFDLKDGVYVIAIRGVEGGQKTFRRLTVSR